MNYKYILFSIVVAGAGLVAVYYFLNQPAELVSKAEEIFSENQEQLSTTSAVTTDKDGETSSVVTESENSITTPPGVTPVSSGESEPAAYTLAEVATRNSESNCWTAINGNVYDLTAFITKHPGGDRNILRICGIDGTVAFNGQHTGQAAPEQTLSEFYLGTLK